MTLGTLQAADDVVPALRTHAAAAVLAHTGIVIGGGMAVRQTVCAPIANAPRRIERIAPADVASRRIGHFGFFREQFAGRLWPRAVQSQQLLHRTA